MPRASVTLTYIGGPTALIEIAGLRLLTDPTFDPAGEDYPAAGYSLHKTRAPAVDVASLWPIDIVLLSHDHHADNLDHAGRRLLARVPRVLTTIAAAERLGRGATGLVPGERVVLRGPDGSTLRITATPARHGPAGGDRGPVIGFLVQPDAASSAIYISGDTVWFEAIADVAKRTPVSVAMLFMGAARVPVAGPAPLTFTAAEAVMAARAFTDAAIVPLHYEGWQHFCESRPDIESAFAAQGLGSRLRWLPPGKAQVLSLEPGMSTAHDALA
jgi:L-ascorbate metabolism protein UlaG (beta-lactamase superfamily)